MKCLRCQQHNPPHAMFCLQCGAPVRRSAGDDASQASYTELQRSLTKALARESAIGEILRVIGSSPTDVQPVFDAIASSATTLCEADHAGLFRFDGQLIHFVAHHGRTPEEIAAATRVFPQPPRQHSVTARAILAGGVVQIADVSKDPELEDALRIFRTVLSVPLMREGHPFGAITVARRVVRPFTDEQIALLKTFADQAVIAIENVRLFSETKEALERQTATSEILRVISSSPASVEAVFDTILANALRLCETPTGGVFTFDGQAFHLAAAAHWSDEFLAALREAAIVPGPETPLRRVGITLEVSHVADIFGDPSFSPPAAYRLEGMRTSLAVPMLKEGRLIGALTFHRREVRPFTEAQIALIKIFADQAVIAIENVRLFTELEQRNRQLIEALEQQTATSEILRTIAGSPTDLRPVLDALIESAAKLCDARRGVILRRDGEAYHGVAFYNTSPELVDFIRRHPVTPGRHTITARVALERRTIHVADLQADPDYRYALRDVDPIRTELGVPMFRGDDIVGVIILYKVEVQPFTDKQIELVETFADQAVIAIENVRLFTELQEKNRELTAAHAQVAEALEQQTATSEVLKVISASTFDLQPVLDILVENATRLCAATQGFLWRLDGELFRIAASYGHSAEVRDFWQRNPIRPSRGSVIGRAALERRTVHIPDVLGDPEYQLPERQFSGYRTLLGVPMLREGVLVGVFGLQRAEVRPFTDKQIELVTTFADQAVIAIENTRLLNELEARTYELTRSVEQLTALGEVGRAVSSTLDLETVLSTIVSRAVQLSGLDGGVVFEYDESAEEFVQRAMTDTGEALAEARRTTRIRKGEGVLGRTAITLEPVQVADIAMPGAYEGRLRELLIDSGIRAILAVPMVREGHLIGCLGVTRNQPGEFPAETIELLRTFATQSALAIQNARLFREIEQKSRELEAASRHKSEFLANMSHELRTPLNAVIGFSEVLTERMFGELNEKQEEYLKDIHASGQHLLSLINDILDLSKIEAGKMELELSDFDLPMTIDNALMLVRERAARRSIALNRAVEERVGQIHADERKIRQVLLNLLSNAIKFTPEGGGIHVEARSVNESIEVSVTDTGVGIAPEDQEAVFEEFRQVGTAEKKVEGTGLGLALSRKFIELHGGKIWVESQVGEGSTFTFTIPVRRGE